MSKGRGRGSPGKDLPDGPRPAPAVVNDKPSAWGKASSTGPPRSPHAASTSSPSSLAKAKVSTKTTVNIAALAARNLGGFVPNKIFVGGVPITCTEDQFRNYFEPYGGISKVELHALRGFGYITYESVEAVDACLEKYEEHYLSKKWVEVKRSIPRELIDSYEREQKRLLAEYMASSEGQAGGVMPKAEPAAPPPLPSAGLPAPSPSTRESPSIASPAAAPPSRPGAWGRPAGPPGAGGDAGMSKMMLSHIRQLKEMGFEEGLAKRVLSECVWDVNKAIDRLFELMSSDTGVEEALAPEELHDPPPPIEELPVIDETPMDAHAELSPTGADAAGAMDPATCSSPNGAEPQFASVHTEASDGGSPGPAGESAPGSPVFAPADVPAGNGSTNDRADAVDAESLPAEAECALEEELVDPVPDSDDGLAVGLLHAPHTPAGASAEADNDVADVAVAVQPQPTPSMPKKRFERAARPWNAEDGSQLQVAPGDFVNVWIDTITENGWIHADKIVADTTQVGWLPACVLQTIDDNKRWMRVRQEWQAMDESQCSASENSMVIVWLNSRTQEGWSYVEAPLDNVSTAAKPGWLPAFCLDWIED